LNPVSVVADYFENIFCGRFLWKNFYIWSRFNQEGDTSFGIAKLTLFGNLVDELRRYDKIMIECLFGSENNDHQRPNGKKYTLWS